MRSNRNASGPVSDSVRGAGERSVSERPMVAKLSMPRMPVEWLDSGNWRLPSGKALAEFALQAGFLAPLLFRADGFGKSTLKSGPKCEMAGSSAIASSARPARGKQFGRGDGR